MALAALSGLGLLLWLVVALFPGRPWSPHVRLEPQPGRQADLGGVTAVIPARNEAATIATVIAALRRQGPGLRILVVDDESADDTAERARAAGGDAVAVIRGEPLPPGWTGKLWALEQARRQVVTPRLLLLDADIELRPGMLAALLERMERDGRALVSVMARLRTSSGVERLSMPAFVWFFGLLYPFALANRPGGRLAAAAGGCILVERRWLEHIGGFAALRDALIDDCTLAARIKAVGGSTWIGLTHGALSRRRCERIRDVAAMVARTAFAQLRFSYTLLGVCTLLMLAAFVAPWVALVAGEGWSRAAGGGAIGLSLALYAPSVRFYGLPFAWVLGLPVAGCLYLAMTLLSAAHHAAGTRAQWRGRRYTRAEPDA